MKRTPLQRKTPLLRKASLPSKANQGSEATLNKGQSESRLGKKEAKPTLRRKGISPASKAQREKARNEPCIVTATTVEWNPVDPAHLWPRGSGGCDDPLCVVPLAREIHQQFDNGNFDLLPYLTKRRVPELCHALGHADGNLIGLLQRLTGERWSSS